VIIDNEQLAGMNPIKASEQLAVRIKQAKRAIRK
jgi:hypothetical protein